MVLGDVFALGTLSGSLLSFLGIPTENEKLLKSNKYNFFIGTKSYGKVMITEIIQKKVPCMCLCNFVCSSLVEMNIYFCCRSAERFY